MNIDAQLNKILDGYETKCWNEQLLVMILTAPDGQISPRLKRKCRETFDRVKAEKITPEELRDFLINDVHKAPITETSGFVRELVNPEYISTKEYMGLEE